MWTRGVIFFNDSNLKSRNLPLWKKGLNISGFRQLENCMNGMLSIMSRGITKILRHKVT